MQFVPSGSPADCVVGFQKLLCNIFGLLQHDSVGWPRKIKKHVKRHCGGQKDRTHRSLLISWWSTFLSFWCLIWCQDRYFLGPWGWIYVARIGCIQKGKEQYVFVEHHFSCSNPAGIFNLNTPLSSFHLMIKIVVFLSENMVLCGWKLVTCSWHLATLHDYCLTKGYPTKVGWLALNMNIICGSKGLKFGLSNEEWAIPNYVNHLSRQIFLRSQNGTFFAPEMFSVRDGLGCGSSVHVHT